MCALNEQFIMFVLMEELFKFYWGYGCKEGIFRERNYNLSVIRAMGARNAFLARETIISVLF